MPHVTGGEQSQVGQPLRVSVVQPCGHTGQLATGGHDSQRVPSQTACPDGHCESVVHAVAQNGLQVSPSTSAPVWHDAVTVQHVGSSGATSVQLPSNSHASPTAPAIAALHVVICDVSTSCCVVHPIATSATITARITTPLRASPRTPRARARSRPRRRTDRSRRSTSHRRSRAHRGRHRAGAPLRSRRSPR